MTIVLRTAYTRSTPQPSQWMHHPLHPSSERTKGSLHICVGRPRRLRPLLQSSVSSVCVQIFKSTRVGRLPGLLDPCIAMALKGCGSEVKEPINSNDAQDLRTIITFRSRGCDVRHVVEMREADSGEQMAKTAYALLRSFIWGDATRMME